MKNRHNPFRLHSLTVAIALGATSSLHAASGTWNVDADGLWGTDTNWLDSVIADDLSSTASFTNNITADRTVRLNGDRTLNSLVFSDNDTSTAGSWILNNNGTSTNNLILSGTTGAAAGTAPVIEVGSLGANKTATISAIIQGSYGFTKTGTGTLVLSGANTYTGTTRLNEGIVRVNASTSLGNSSGNIIFGGGTLQYGVDVNYGTRIKNSSTAIVLDVNGRNIGFTSQQGIDDSNIGGLNLVNSGDTTTTVSGGTLLFNGGNTFSGGVSVGDKVRLRLQNAGALSNNTVSIQNGGQLLVNAALIITNNLNIAGAGWTGDTGGIALGAIRFNSGTTSDIQGQVTLSSAATVSATAGVAGTISGKITGDHALTIGAGAGTGSVTISSSSNDYTGSTSIATGTLKLGATGTIAASSSISISAAAVLDTTSQTSFTLSGSQPVTFKVDGVGSGSCGRITADGIAISDAVVSFDIVNPLDDAAYVLASYTSKSGTAFASATPPAGYKLDYSYNGGTQIALVQSGFASWININFPSLPDKTLGGDPDNDGVENMLEYVLNGNPTISDPAILPDLDASGANFIFTFTRREESIGEISQIFQYGSNLSAWTDVTITGTPGPEVTLGSPTEGLQTVTVTIPKSAASTDGKLFGRLQVVKLP